MRNPIYPNDLTKDENHKAMESLIFFSEKRDDTKKAEHAQIEAHYGFLSQRKKFRACQ